LLLGDYPKRTSEHHELCDLKSFRNPRHRI
jgi:hypothetical protein